jgi:hypothetical protein
MKTIIILGMHRSMTSLITKGLADNQVYIGDKLMPPNGGNPKGYWEDTEFVRMNNRILALAGGTWRDLPSEKKILTLKKKYGSEIEDLIKRKEERVKEIYFRENERLWGWKDPRTILTIKLYLPYLTNPHFILCFRDPLEVAKSFNKTEKIPIKEGINLWREYNRRMISFITDYYIDLSTSFMMVKGE